ncbi:MAG: hypothetical protein IKK34_02640 [Clostridia bacterium]|nr:hypothetical protein [Clostridia bacterium]
MIALLLSLYRVFGKREIIEENEREYARMPVRARENTTQHFKADGLQAVSFSFSLSLLTVSRLEDSLGCKW